MNKEVLTTLITASGRHEWQPVVPWKYNDSMDAAAGQSAGLPGNPDGHGYRAEWKADFMVEVTADGDGVIITRYTGTAAAVHIPSAIQGLPVREIGDRAFFDNHTVTGVVIPDGVTRIGVEAFACTDRGKSKMKLSSVTIPEGVTEIDNEAFQNCPLTAVTLPRSLTTLGHSAFRDTGITAVTIPSGITNFLLNPYGISGAFYECTKLKTVTMLEGIKDLPGTMFSGCTALTTVIFPEGVGTIDAGAFYGCTALTAVALPASIRRIDEQVFSGCENLVTVTIPEPVETIRFGDNAFARCPKLSAASQTAIRKRGYMGEF